MTAPTSRAAILDLQLNLPARIERIQQLARDATAQYRADIQQGDPAFPDWTHDAIAVCNAAAQWHAMQVIDQDRHERHVAQRKS